MATILELLEQSRDIEQRIRDLETGKIVETDGSRWMERLEQVRSKIFTPSGHSAQALVQQGAQAHDHLQLQIDAIREVLGEMGYGVNGHASDPLEMPQKVQDLPYSTPHKLKNMQIDSPARSDASGSPTLQDLGLSKMGMALLAPDKSELFSPERKDSFSSKISPPRMGARSLLHPVTTAEFQGLSSHYLSQLTIKYIDMVVLEIKDLVADKRFEQASDPEAFSLKELINATRMDPVRLEAALNALVHLNRLSVSGKDVFRISSAP